MRNVKREIREWAQAVGEKNAVGRLVSRGISSRAAERLCAGDYPSEPKSLREALIDEMSKDGFPVSDGKAS